MTFPTDGDFSSVVPNPKETPIATTGARRREPQYQPATLCCRGCSSDVAFAAQIVSKGFTGRHGRAYLVSSPLASASHLAVAVPQYKPPRAEDGGADLANVRVGRPENRQLVTGQHVVADITCVVCGARLGWKYVDAHETDQKYKIGKFILETQRVVANRNWEDVDGDDGDVIKGDGLPRAGGARGGVSAGAEAWRKVDLLCDPAEETAKFDSEGEEEERDEVVVFDSEDEEECEDIFAGVWDPAVVAKRRKGKVANLRKKGGMQLA